MDEQELNRRREEARAAGYTDEQIDAYLAGQYDRVDRSPTPGMDRTAETVATTGIGVAQAAKSAAIPVAGAYGAKKLYDMYKNRPVAPAPGPVGPAAAPGPAPGTPQYTFESLRSPTGQPAAPAAPQPAPAGPAPQPAPQPSMAQRVQQMAMNKLTKAGSKIGIGALAALTPGNIGQDYPFPTSGPLRGSEINPNTGRPWTREELAQYNASYR